MFINKTLFMSIVHLKEMKLLIIDRGKVSELYLIPAANNKK